jgi:polyisoprenoid-binding protein YceI
MGKHQIRAVYYRKINQKEFGLTWNALETGGVLVGEDIKLVSEIQLKQQ